MGSSNLRALVVDDERAIRKLVTMALRKEGFSCDEAADGEEALQQIARTEFDVVVTDLRMPNKHGHALSVELLSREHRPVIVVHTAVLEPRLAKDLLSRGVDDVVFKPVAYSAFAGKVKALVQRRMNVRPTPAKADADSKGTEKAGNRVAWGDIQRRLKGTCNIPCISQTALGVYQLTCDDNCEAEEIAQAMKRDASLVMELLRIGNSTYYNPAGNNIDDLEQIVLRIGRKRIGELALAINAMASLTEGLLPWINVELAWKRSVAAGIAIELLLDRGGYRGLERGLLLSASIQSFGRVILGTLYPHHYEAMLQSCRETGSSLLDLEHCTFPKTHAQVMAHVLAQWNVSSDVYEPLKHVLEENRLLSGLPDRLRTQVELVKLAVLFGRIVVGDWASWDTVDLPSFAVVKRLGISSVDDVVANTRHSLEKVLDGHIETSPLPGASAGEQKRPLPYCSLMAEQSDFLAALLPAMGHAPERFAPENLKDQQDMTLVNCIGSSPRRLQEFVKPQAAPHLFIVCDDKNIPGFHEFGETIGLPTSYDKLNRFCSVTWHTPKA